MLITIFGASGNVGKRVVSVALAKGHEVRAFGRNVEGFIDADLAHRNIHAIRGYVFNEEDVFKAVQGADAVLSVLGGDFLGTDKTRSLGMKNIIHQMEKAGVKRIVALGGMGVLQQDENSIILESEHYPEQYLPVGREHLEAYNYLKESFLDWTFIGSPDIRDEEGDGLFTVKDSYVPDNNAGHIKAGNIALFMVMELEKNEHIKKAVGISDIEATS